LNGNKDNLKNLAKLKEYGTDEGGTFRRHWRSRRSLCSYLQCALCTRMCINIQLLWDF